MAKKKLASIERFRQAVERRSRVIDMIDDVCKEIIDSDSERFMWVAMNMADEIGGLDLHELAWKYAKKNGRGEPIYEDYGDAVREAIDHAEYLAHEQRMALEAK